MERRFRTVQGGQSYLQPCCHSARIDIRTCHLQAGSGAMTFSPEQPSRTSCNRVPWPRIRRNPIAFVEAHVFCQGGSQKVGSSYRKTLVTTQVVRFTVHGWWACALHISWDSWWIHERQRVFVWPVRKHLWIRWAICTLQRLLGSRFTVGCLIFKPFNLHRSLTFNREPCNFEPE